MAKQLRLVEDYQLNRPEYINRILEKIGSVDDTDYHETTATLKAYIVDLEVNQSDRPEYINRILGMLASEVSTDVRFSLDTYITSLEHQQGTLQGDPQVSLTALQQLPL